ncbi:MAG: hypothetical protein OXJ52_08935 [Oligoflexia bacterium]|nr:hypothetical protein [Oligoflexia bacterium]
MKKEKELLSQALKKIAQYLNFRSHSQKELKQKLSNKFPTTLIEKALNQARQKNWLEDPLELSQKTAERLQEKNKSWGYIQDYLKHKELPLPPYNREKELEKARKLLQKQSFSQKNQLQMKQFLANRSFETDIIDEALEKLTSDK